MGCSRGRGSVGVWGVGVWGVGVWECGSVGDGGDGSVGVWEKDLECLFLPISPSPHLPISHAPRLPFSTSWLIPSPTHRRCFSIFLNPADGEIGDEGGDSLVAFEGKV